MRCVLLLGLKRGLSGRVWRTEVPEHRRWKRSEKDAKGFPGSDVRQGTNCVCSSVAGERMKFLLTALTVKRYFSYAALLRCGHQRAIALYLKAINIGLGASLVVQWFKNPPANAGDTGSILDPGRFHMPQGNSAQCATTPEPTHLLSSLESSLCVSKKTHHSQKQNKRKNAYKMSMI